MLTKSATTVEGTRAVLDEIEKMRQQAPTEDELQLAKDSYLNSFVFNFDRRSEILNRLMTYEYYGYPRDFLQQIKNGVQEVTAEDVLRVSKKYLHPDQVDILVVGRQQDFSEPLSALTKRDDVNEIDITIPTQPPGDADAEEPAVSEADRAQGKEALMQVRKALGGSAYEQVENVRVSAEQVINSPQGEMTIQSKSTVALPDQIRIEQQLPMGTITLVSNGEETIMKTPQGTQQAPPQVKKQIKSQLWRDLTYLMAHADDETLEVQTRDTTEVDGQTYEALRIRPPEGESYTLLVDPKTMRPARMQYQAMTRQGPKDAYVIYEDYRKVSGVMVPFSKTTYQNGEQAAVTTVQDVTVNADLEDSAFDVNL